jgi:Cu(I)/Ag(I) efflux system membrane protein CusA/SilA
MIGAIIDWCNRNRFIVMLALAAVALGGVWSAGRIPLDALPDISDVQVIIRTRWPGQPPTIIEDQVTYPIVTAMLAAPLVKAVRAQTMPNDSFVYVIFEDGTDLYWARSRVVEYLQRLGGRMPAGVAPTIGPDATGAGWVFEYVVIDRSGNLSLADLRTLQDFKLRYALETVPGVAEVATIGGFVRQYQVKLDPSRLLALGVSLDTVVRKIRESNNEVGGRMLDMSGASYLVRGLGYIKSLDDVEQIAVGARDGTPILVRDLGVVSFGPDIREGVAEWNGEGEVVGGIVVMRDGENALAMIDRVKRKIGELAASLPPGVEIVPAYDRAGLISDSIATLRRDLIAEAVIVSAVIIVFLMHFRSALIPILTIPLALLASFIPMYWLRVSSNIMSLGGFVLAIGVLVDAAIVMVENGHRRLSDAQADARGHGSEVDDASRVGILMAAAKQVGRPIFFSLLIIVISFLPVFMLEAQEGRMFHPLAWTKTFAMTFSSVLAITAVPVLMVWLVRGRRIRPESENPLSRSFQAIYLPVMRWSLRNRWLVIAANFVFLALTIPLAFTIGSQFMPPLYEGSILYMPTTPPGISITQTTELLQTQDRILRSFPEVATVFGTVGRADSATDNSPLDMFNTAVMLKPRSEWRPGMTYERLVQEMDAKLRFPGVTNTWTMPIATRLDMVLTGIKTPIGLKIQGPELGEIHRIGAEVEELLKGVEGTRGVFAERVSQGFYVNVEVKRAVAAQYGLTVADVQLAITSAIGGENVTTAIDGRNRFPVNLRYLADFRATPDALRAVLIMTPSGAQVPLGEVAEVKIAPGPAMIRDEGGELTGYVFLDLSTSDYGGYVTRAEKLLEKRLKLPPGYSLEWSGQYSFALRARERLLMIVPVVFAAILVMLYLLLRSAVEATVLLVPCLYALSGGLLLQYLMGFNYSVAVAVGYIALFGIAVETGVVMITYLNEALDARLARGPADGAAIEEAAIEGAVRRLRPKLMTVATVMLSLTPVLWDTGVGSDVMKPIAAPIVGGMITSTIHVLILVPVFFAMMKERALSRGTLAASHISAN